MNQNKIGKIIETKRKEKKLTQQQLAELLGVSNTAISKWEHGNNMPDIGLLAPLSEILEIDLITLINTQNSVHEEYSKKYIKLRKIKAYKAIATLVIFIGIICLTNYFTYTKSSNKLKDHISKQTEVYRFTSKDPNFCIDGYMIFNNKESIIILEKLVYQGKDDYEIDYENIENAFYYISGTDFHVLMKEISIKNTNVENLNDIFKSIKTFSYSTKKSLNQRKNKFNDLFFELEIIDNNDKKMKVDVDLNVKKHFR